MNNINTVCAAYLIYYCEGSVWLAAVMKLTGVAYPFISSSLYVHLLGATLTKAGFTNGGHVLCRASLVEQMAVR